MTNVEAVEWAHEIRNGCGIDLFDFLKRVELAPMMKEDPKDTNNPFFMLGVEYGVLYAIAKIMRFDNKI